LSPAPATPCSLCPALKASGVQSGPDKPGLPILKAGTMQWPFLSAKPQECDQSPSWKVPPHHLPPSELPLQEQEKEDRKGLRGRCPHSQSPKNVLCERKASEDSGASDSCSASNFLSESWVVSPQHLKVHSREGLFCPAPPSPECQFPTAPQGRVFSGIIRTLP
jgi:hypothetical protein